MTLLRPLFGKEGNADSPLKAQVYEFGTDVDVAQADDGFEVMHGNAKPLLTCAPNGDGSEPTCQSHAAVWRRGIRP